MSQTHKESPSFASGKRLLSVAEFAAALGVTQSCIRRWVLERKIAFVKLGRLVRIDSQEGDRLIREGSCPRREARS
jgi:excisionase family DNA binding protein